MRDLSVLIPARREQWLAHTVADVLAHAELDTEVIVVCDGELPLEPLPQHPNLTVVLLPHSIGQRAATNLAARLSRATFLMKLDAHCSMAQGFDRVLAEHSDPTLTQVPLQYNLHVFNWRCVCGHTEYQGPLPTECKCGAPRFTQEVVWQRRLGRRGARWRFDSELHFQYWGVPRNEGMVETMSCLGACWFLERDRYWAIEGMDEAHGSWGQMGTELACKSWLSGGRMVTNCHTWFAHMFRTQPGFAFPYGMEGAAQAHAKAYSQDLWRSNRWPKQVRPLRWLIERFAPVPGWTPEQIEALPAQLPSVGIIYYSDNEPDSRILDAAQHTIVASGLPISAVTLGGKPWMEAQTHQMWPPTRYPRGVLTMCRQILAALEALETEFVFFCEHDVLYHPSHFTFRPPDPTQYWYNLNVWKVDAASGKALTYRTKQVSGLCGNRKLLISHYVRRIARIECNGYSASMGFEPGSHRRKGRIDDVPSNEWRSPSPNVDIRHGLNLTPSRWAQSQFRDQRNCQEWQESGAIPGWGQTAGRFWEWLAEVSVTGASHVQDICSDLGWDRTAPQFSTVSDPAGAGAGPGCAGGQHQHAGG